MTAHPSTAALLLLLASATGCVGSPGDRQDDGGGPGDTPFEESSRPEVEDADGGDEGADDGAEDGESDCTICDTPCEGTEVTCGTWCCIGQTRFFPDGGTEALDCYTRECNWAMFYRGLLVVDWERYPGLQEDRRFPRLTDYRFRGDGTELLLAVTMAEMGNYYDCINRCYEGRSHFWVVDIPTRRVVYAQAGEIRAGADRMRPAVTEFSDLADEVSGGWPCPSPREEGFSVACRDLAVVPERDETFWVGYDAEYVIYGWSNRLWMHLDWREYFPWLPYAVDVYRTSERGPAIDTVDLRLVEMDRTVWRAADGP